MNDRGAIVARVRSAVRRLDDPPLLPAPERVDAPAPLVRVRPAAVLVPFVPRDDRLSVLFTRRNPHLRHHAGQISFPGGGIDPGDADAVAAALRETREETGIDEAQVDPFGYLDCLDTVSGYCVTPVTGFVRSDYAVRLHEDEVDEVFEVPFEYILEPGTLRSERIHWGGRDRDVFTFDWEGRRIWGATAAILKNLLDRMQQR
jgi:8-oxo-dGTP pyrophosphatase MutT (NUDIX family)